MPVVHTSKADLMHEIECLDRGQDSALNGCHMMLSGDIQEGEERRYKMGQEDRKFQLPMERYALSTPGLCSDGVPIKEADILPVCE